MTASRMVRPAPAGGVGRPQWRKLIGTALCFASILALLSSCSSEPGRTPEILGEINNEYLTADEFLHHFRTRGGVALEGTGRAEFKRWLLAELVDRKLMLQEARRRRIRPRREEVRREIELLGRKGWEQTERSAFEGVEDELYEQRQIKDLLRVALPTPTLPDARDIERFRVRHPAEFRRPARIRLRQSVVHSASMVTKAFRDLSSVSPLWHGRDDLPGEIWSAAWSAVPGAASGPVVTAAGWHVFEVLERHTSEPLPDVEAVALARRSIADERRHAATLSYVERLRAAATIRVDARALDAL